MDGLPSLYEKILSLDDTLILVVSGTLVMTILCIIVLVRARHPKARQSQEDSTLPGESYEQKKCPTCGEENYDEVVAMNRYPSSAVILPRVLVCKTCEQMYEAKIKNISEAWKTVTAKEQRTGCPSKATAIQRIEKIHVQQRETINKHYKMLIADYSLRSLVNAFFEEKMVTLSDIVGQKLWEQFVSPHAASKERSLVDKTITILQLPHGNGCLVRTRISELMDEIYLELNLQPNRDIDIELAPGQGWGFMVWDSEDQKYKFKIPIKDLPTLSGCKQVVIVNKGNTKKNQESMG